MADELKKDSIKKNKNLSKLVGTFFRNALRSNLDLTSLADTKAGILISINGFILTVSVTATSFAVHNVVMTYAFIAIIITSLGSIIFAVMAVKPRTKDKLVKKEFLDGYSSLLYYQDMADLTPDEYSKEMNQALYSTRESKEEMISHLHILGTEIKKKYFWLKQAYTFFSLGLIVSASLIIYALISVEKTAFYNLSKGNVIYKQDKFYNVFEPSGAATMPDGKVLIVEDESNAKSLKLLEIEEDGSVVEIGNLYLPKQVKKIFKKGVEDLEALTLHNEMVYAITSHTYSKSGKRKASREKLMMFRYDDGAIEDFSIYGDLKKDLQIEFSELFKQTLFTKNSMDIEGMASDIKGGGLLIAFKSPIVEDKALLIPLYNPKELLLGEEEAKFGKKILLDLKGLGIRDIFYDPQKKAYWIIAGSKEGRESRFELWFWERETESLSLVKNQPNIGYGEGITLIKQKSENPGLFIVEDNGKKPNKSADYLIIDRESL
jgi:hypothetical protein